MSNRNFRENIARTSSEGDVTGRVEVRCGPRQINISLMLVVRLVDGQKVHLGTRRTGGRMTQSMKQSDLNVNFGKNGKRA